MSDGVALRAAICANPDDDTARLVYADWLEENEQAKRAHFIRAKVEEERLDVADTAARDLSWLVRFDLGAGRDRVDWAAVDAELGAHVADAKRFNALVSPLSYESEGVPQIEGVMYTGWARGFYHCLYVESAAAFLKHAPALFRAAPINSAVFERMTAAQARELARAGYLARFRELTFGEAVEPEAVRVLGAHADAAAVRKLELTHAKHLAPLAAGTRWTGARELSIRGLQPRGAARDTYAELFARPWCRGVRTVEANNSELNARAAEALAAHCPELRSVMLHYNPIGNAGARAFARAKALPHLRALNLSVCGIESAEVRADLISTARLPALALLDVSGNDAGLDAGALARGTRAPTLRALVMTHAQMTAEATGALAAHPALAGLYVLDLSASELGDEAAEALFRAPAFERLAYLDLGHIDMGPRGAKALAAWPGAVRLQWLNLYGNALGESGCKALARSTHLKNLKALRADGRGVSHLKKRFKKVLVDDE